MSTFIVSRNMSRLYLAPFTSQKMSHHPSITASGTVFSFFILSSSSSFSSYFISLNLFSSLCPCFTWLGTSTEKMPFPLHVSALLLTKASTPSFRQVKIRRNQNQIVLPENILTCCWSIQRDKSSLSCCWRWRRSIRPPLLEALSLLLLCPIEEWFMLASAVETVSVVVEAVTVDEWCNRVDAAPVIGADALQNSGPTSRSPPTARSKRPVMKDACGDDVTRVMGIMRHIYPTTVVPQR